MARGAAHWRPTSDFATRIRVRTSVVSIPMEIADDTVLVARATDDAGAILATVVNYACHPTTLAWENRLISPDFPGRDARAGRTNHTRAMQSFSRERRAISGRAKVFRATQAWPIEMAGSSATRRCRQWKPCRRPELDMNYAGPVVREQLWGSGSTRRYRPTQAAAKSSWRSVQWDGQLCLTGLSCPRAMQFWPRGRDSKSPDEGRANERPRPWRAMRMR